MGHAVRALRFFLCSLIALGTACVPPPAAAARTKENNLPLIKRPKAHTKSEAAYIARLKEQLAPIVRTKISKNDIKNLKKAFDLVKKNKIEAAQNLQGRIEDPVARKLIDWRILRSGAGTPGAYRTFLAENPYWGSKTLLRARSDEALFRVGGSVPEIKTHFSKRAPSTGAGHAALASAHLAEGNTREARRHAALAWRNHDFPKELEKGFLTRFGPMLTAADHKWRLDRLIVGSVRWRGSRNRRATKAKRVIKLLSKPEQRKAKARLAAFNQSKRARGALAKLPAESAPDWGLVYHRVQTLRRSRKYDKAANLLLGAPTQEALIVSPDDWWVERRANAYEALERKKYKLAYEIVREAGPLSANPLKEQNFMAGWIALRYLKDPNKARPHFERVKSAADGPLSRAKASYWLGRLAEAQGRKKDAKTHYQAATQEPETFHGQLALQKLNGRQTKISLPAPRLPTSSEVSKLTSLTAAKAVIIAHKADLPKYVSRAFLTQLRISFRSEGELALVAQLAESVGDTQQAVRAGKRAIALGHNLHYFAYPIHPFPAYRALRNPPEAALLLGLARQETEFNTKIVSGAGAKGLLQVMSGTAKHICRQYRIRCNIRRLRTDPSFNAMLAAAYVGDRQDDFAGSYILTLVGYNAGPGRARQWIRDIGDPRSTTMDPVDWIEHIPIKETRQYVAKVLSNVQIYRARLGEQKPLRLKEDLSRGRASAYRG